MPEQLPIEPPSNKPARVGYLLVRSTFRMHDAIPHSRSIGLLVPYYTRTNSICANLVKEKCNAIIQYQDKRYLQDFGA